MKKFVIYTAIMLLFVHLTSASSRDLNLAVNPDPAVISKNMQFSCLASGDWELPLKEAEITIWNAGGDRLINKADMQINGLNATFDYTILSGENAGTWEYKCDIEDDHHDKKRTISFEVEEEGSGQDPTLAHQSIQSYEGPQTCITCHQNSAEGMLNSLHMQWSGPTPELTNTNDESLGKSKKGINTFCTYAPSSKGACYSCHVRADGNAPHEPELKMWIV